MDIPVKARLSDEDMERIIQLVRDQGQPTVAPAAFKAAEAATYIGISKSAFYELLKANPDLDGASIYLGATRVWPKRFLDLFLEQKQGQRLPKLVTGEVLITAK
jgi:hypothetical protein